MKDHLDKCNLCRNNLRQRMLYIREYTRRIRDPHVRSIAKTIVDGNTSRQETKILRFAPYEDEDDPRHQALAAQTEPLRKETPLRYISEDEELILREFEDSESGERSFCLIGKDPDFVREATVVIQGKSYRSNAEGRVLFGEDAPDLDETTTLIVRKASR
jgi:hypothetical protein